MEPSKFRFVSAASAIAFPLNLGKDLGATTLPRLHSYAWNAGTRPESFPTVTSVVPQLVTWEELQKLSSIYFSVVHPAFAVVSKDQFMQRCADHWIVENKSLSFDAIASGICALGSLFAGELRSEVESELVRHAKDILDNIGMIHGASEDLVIAWILRSLYLRSTTRPHASWMSTCTTMHVAEAVGLHREMTSLTSASSQSVRHLPNSRHLETRRKIFWIAWSLNVIFSSEYGRSAVKLDFITCQEPMETDGDYTLAVIRLAKLMPSGRPDRDLLSGSLPELSALEDQPAFLCLLQTSVSFCIFRQLRLCDPGPTREQIDKVTTAGDRALRAARSLALADHVWWDVLAIPFHHICVLLSIGTEEILALLPEARAALRDIVAHLQTHMAREAEQTAHSLIDMCLQKKTRETSLLRHQPIERSSSEFIDLDQAIDASADHLRTSQPEMQIPTWMYDLQVDWAFVPGPLEEMSHADIHGSF